MLSRMFGTISRFQHLGRRRRRLLIDAALALCLASTALALLPFRRAILLGSVELGTDRTARVEDCIWAVEAAARWLPWRTVCIQHGLAAQRLLRRAGIDARLHYGARHEPGTAKLQAHVWVTVDGKAVIGGSEAANFAEIAAFP